MQHYRVSEETLWSHRLMPSSHQWTLITFISKIHQIRIRCHILVSISLNYLLSTVKDKMESLEVTLEALTLLTSMSHTILMMNITLFMLSVAWKTHGPKHNNLHISSMTRTVLSISTKPVLLLIMVSTVILTTLRTQLTLAILTQLSRITGHPDPLNSTKAARESLIKIKSIIKFNIEDSRLSAIKIFTSSSNKWNKQSKQPPRTLAPAAVHEETFSKICKALLNLKNEIAYIDIIRNINTRLNFNFNY